MVADLNLMVRGWGELLQPCLKGRKGASRGREYDVLLREPDAGNPHVRFDERDVETERLVLPRHVSTLHL